MVLCLNLNNIDPVSQALFLSHVGIKVWVLHRGCRLLHLAAVLKNWFWKDNNKEANALNVWQQTCHQLYLPRLKDDVVFQQTMGAGAESRDFFGFAQGKEEGRYVGFTFGKRASLFLDSSLLLIQPATAAAYSWVKLQK